MPWHFGGPPRLTVGEWKKITAYFDEGATGAGDLPDGWDNLPMEE